MTGGRIFTAGKELPGLSQSLPSFSRLQKKLRIHLPPHGGGLLSLERAQLAEEGLDRYLQTGLRAWNLAHGTQILRLRISEVNYSVSRSTSRSNVARTAWSSRQPGSTLTKSSR